MSIQDQITADQANVATAQAALDAANAQLATDQATLAAAQPHLTVLAEIEQYIEQIPGEMRDQFASLIAKARALF